jgi:hypothetical protein
MAGGMKAVGPNADLVDMAREAIQEAWDFDQDNRREAATDLEFVAGKGQWPESVRREREADGRPMLTINTLPQFVYQVTNDIRQADPAIKVSPVDDKSDPELAKVYNGLLRQIQYQSSATHVYAAAASHQVICGMGWWRVTSIYADDMSWDQELRIKLIPNPLSVYWDPAAVEPDKSDAKWIAVTELCPKRTFEKLYPEIAAESMPVPSDNRSDSFFWNVGGDYVRKAEFGRKVPVRRRLGLTSEGQSIDLTDVPREMIPFLPPIVRERVVDTYRIEQFVCSGSAMLSEITQWPGKHIPIVPVFGSEVPLERGVVRHGLIRFAREPMQLYNYYRTAVAEAIALAPKAPYIATVKQIAKYKAMWAEANRTPRPVLLYEPDERVPGGKPQREHPPEVPAALMQEAAIAREDIKAVTGIYDPSLGNKSNETSGRAIIARQREGDTANYHFADNLNRALEHTGRILIDLIPRIYDNERVVRLMGEDDSEEFAPINRVLYGEDGQPVMVNDLSAGRFDVRVSIGPSYSTKRMESADAMLQFVQAYPGAAPLIGDLIAKNMDWPGAEEIAKRLRNAVPPQILADPDDPQAPQPSRPADDPAAQLQLASVEADRAELQNMIDFQIGQPPDLPGGVPPDDVPVA